MRRVWVVAACVAAAVLAGCGPTPARMAAHLAAAREAGRPVAPLTAKYGDLSLDEAYRVQDALVARLVRDGCRVTGYKIGYASRASQQAWGITEPAYGRLLDAMEVPDGCAIGAADLHQFHIEVEVAVVIGRRIDRPLKDATELMPYVRSVHAAFDIPDNRFDPAAGERRLADIIADGVGAHHYVLGPPRDPREVDVDKVVGVIRHDGREVYRGPATAVMGSPYSAVLWLAEALLQRGFALEEGDVVLTGALDKAYAGEGGRIAGQYVGDCGPLGRVTCSVVGE